MSDQNLFPNPAPTPQGQPGGPDTPRRHRRGGNVVVGGILIAVGLMALAQQILPMVTGLLFLPALAVIFLAAGVLGRRPGLVIPGGILGGIGAGAILVSSRGPLAYLEDPAKGGIFMLTFAAGWLLIVLLSPLAGRTMLWPLIPAAFMGMIGLGLVAGQAGLQILQWAGVGWPVILIALGLYLVFRRRELRK